MCDAELPTWGCALRGRGQAHDGRHAALSPRRASRRPNLRSSKSPAQEKGPYGSSAAQTDRYDGPLELQCYSYVVKAGSGDVKWKTAKLQDSEG